MARLLGGGLLTATTLLLVGGLPGVAAADTRSGRDRAHDVDAYSFSPEPLPCGTLTKLDGSHDRTTDLRRLTVDHRASEVVLSAELRRFSPTAYTSTTFHLRTPRGKFLVQVDAQVTRRKPFVLLPREPHHPNPSGPCNSVSVQYDGHPCPHLQAVISLADDGDHLGHGPAHLPGPTRLGAGRRRSARLVDLGPAYSYSDAWAHRRGHGMLCSLPSYEPRVAPDPSAAAQ